MKRVFPLLLLAIWCVGTAQAKIDLPVWENPSEAGEYYLGGGLWPKSLIPDATAAAASPDPQAVTESEGTALANGDPEFVGPPAPQLMAGTTGNPVPRPEQFYGPASGVEELAGGDPALQRVRENPDGTFTLPEEVVEEEAYEPLPPLEGELADLYFAHAPVEFLIDPQRLLTEQKSNDIMRFLEFHSDESKIRIYVMVIGENQQIPDDVDIEALHKKWFSDSPAVLMLYYREQPQQTQLVFNESIRSSLPPTVFDRILQNCLREGAMADLAPDQVEKMSIELSIQLYWLSRLMEHEGKGDSALTSASSVHEMMASRDAPELLREYAPGIFIDEGGKVLSIILTVVFILGGLCVVGCTAWIVMWWRGREQVSGEPLLFPEFRIVPRLGGEYCGGGFVSMSFELNEGS